MLLSHAGSCFTVKRFKMESTLQVALIAFAGVLVGGLISGIYQRQNLKVIIAAEFDKLLFQHRSVILQETLTEKKQQVIKGVSKIIATTDLEVNRDIDFSAIVRSINEVQLYLNPENQLERNINGCLNDIAHATKRVVLEGEHQENLLEYQGRLIDSVQKFINQSS